MPKLAAVVKEQRRKQLLDAAWRCVARGGYRNLSVDDVCAEAGLCSSEPTFGPRSPQMGC
ncbi:MAG TPA: TetR/AcrR family transcriptional regulator [Acidimicrobiales bacterium]